MQNGNLTKKVESILKVNNKNTFSLFHHYIVRAHMNTA